MVIVNLIHVLVFFISISSEPVHPGEHKYGSGVSWVLYGAPSSQKAREWAQAKWDKTHAKDDVPQKITEFLVLPMSDTLLTQKGAEPVAWTALPCMGDMHWSEGREQEFYASGAVQPVNKKSAQMEKAQEMTLEQLHALVDKQMTGAMKWSWDEGLSWYYIFYTTHQAMLVKAVNQVAATLPYGKSVRGTPAGDESARIEAWQALTQYSE